MHVAHGCDRHGELLDELVTDLYPRTETLWANLHAVHWLAQQPATASKDVLGVRDSVSAKSLLEVFIEYAFDRCVCSV